MRSVIFIFRRDVPSERQEAVLAQIGMWETIHKTGHLKPDAKRPDILRMCYAYLKDNTDIGTVAKRLSELPEVESVDIPAERQLI